jgi:aldose 1-epimerase
MSSALELFELGSDAWRVRIAPALGGSIIDARWHRRDVLRPMPEAELLARNVRKSACYPLVPFSNRIAFGSFRFGAAQYALVKNLADMPHAIHGIGFQRAWSVQEITTAAIDMRLSHLPDDCWPFGFEAQQRISIVEDSLVLKVRVTNTDARAAPCGVGWHPFFPLDSSTGMTKLSTAWTSMLVSDENDLPCANTEPPHFGALDDTIVDNCFTGWSGRARIDTPHHRVTIEANDVLRCAVLFRPADKPFFAFEPVSHANNALNGNEPPMDVLSPGESLEASVKLSMIALTTNQAGDDE